MPTLLAPEKIIGYPLVTLTGEPASIVVYEANGVDIVIDPAFLKPHRKDYYFFAFVEQGSSRHWIDFLPYTVKPKHMYFTVPQQVHLKEESTPIKGYVASFTAEFLMLEENRILRNLPIIRNPSATHELTLTDEDYKYLEDVMSKMAAEYTAGGDWQNHMLTSWLRVMLIYLSRLYNEQFGDHKVTQNYCLCLFKKFQELIGEHYATTHDVATYADLLNITPGHLNDSVKQHSGKTAISHIHDRLIVEAKRSMLHTDLSVKQIADELGFEDAAYFNRFFKRLTDLTPMAFRHQIREMYN
ncbi:helix-turn-helix domain-containing protein [Mucilaginibacter conchicola]|uniref:Helix-turn-helix domain-containing protein n=1 Tax=Mucilaginibacter conchicola TaxID=2303333 RepID=A0A372NP24_9SPHI|nr:helix-turn-helix domain-containing protein [Mucilaginibacter conchicola]RFZ90682.1 helix-turn-helix domain-containing protein [Mucilaginibacter conchicola]